MEALKWFYYSILKYCTSFSITLHYWLRGGGGISWARCVSSWLVLGRPPPYAAYYRSPSTYCVTHVWMTLDGGSQSYFVRKSLYICVSDFISMVQATHLLCLFLKSSHYQFWSYWIIPESNNVFRTNKTLWVTFICTQDWTL